MGYPQPNSNQAVLAGDKVFRLQTRLVSAGDTYDSQQSGYGFAIGPDSDIANVVINYYDETQPPTNMNQVTIGAGSPYVGLIKARNEPSAVYLPQKTPGRIIFSIGDIVPVLLQPLGMPAPPSNEVQIAPVLDILQYLTPPPSGIVAPRNDKEYFFAVPPTGTYTNNVLIFDIPFYGRSYADIIAYRVSGGGGGTYKMQIDALRYGFGVADLAVPSIKSILANTLIVGTLEQVVRAATNGMFDYLRVTIQSSGGSADDIIELGIRVSDTAK